MDAGRGRDALGVAVGTRPVESGRGTTHWLVERWDSDAVRWVRRKTGLVEPLGRHFHQLRVRPYSVSEVYGNLITNAGWTLIMSLLTDQGSATPMDDTHTRIGVGDGDTAATATDSDLDGENKHWEPVSGAGTLGTRTLQFSATFGAAVANFDWKEFGIDVSDSEAEAGSTVGDVLFNRKVTSQGTKANGQVWTATATITFDPA